MTSFIPSTRQREVSKIYRLVYQQLAKQDLKVFANEIFEYTGHKESAINFLSAIESAVLQLRDFPYSCSTYFPAKRLLREYRVKPCGRYNIFYLVDEKKKEVLIARIIRARMQAGDLQLKD